MPNDSYRVLLDRARSRPPEHPYPTVSGFAKWVWSLYAPKQERTPGSGYARAERQILGRIAERKVEEYRARYRAKTGSSGLKLVFRDPLDEKVNPLFASRLIVDGEPMRGVPDLVLADPARDFVLVIERKLTFVPEERIPKMGWPNLMVQLWCYAWMDQWARCQRVYLMGEIWRHDLTRKMNILSKVRPVWRREDSSRHDLCRTLFELYGGKFVTENLSIAGRK